LRPETDSSNQLQTPENRALLTKWLDKIWTDCGRHLRDLELKFMASRCNIRVADALPFSIDLRLYFTYSM
jgi:hypothetical protein